MRRRSCGPGIGLLLVAVGLGSLVLSSSPTGAQKTIDPRLTPQLPVAIPILGGLTLNPSSVTGGAAPVQGTVSLAQPAPSGGVTVKLQSSNPQVVPVPSTIVVQSGATTATFVLQPQPVTQNPNVVTSPPTVDISGQIGNATPRIAKLTVLPATLASLMFEPASVAGGVASTGKVTITGAAPSGGLGVTLSSANATATVPPQVTIPKGATETTFQVATKAVTTATPVQVTAARGVFVTRTATLTVLPPSIASLSFEPTWVTGGTSTTGKVTLTAPAPAGGFTISLTKLYAQTSSPCLVWPTMAPSIQVAGGSTVTTFPVATYPTKHTWVHFRASSGGPTADGYIGLGSPGLQAFTLPSSVKGGNTVQASVQLAGPAHTPECSLYTVEVSDPAYVQAPSQFPFAAGQTTQTFSVTTSAVTASKTVTVRVKQVNPSPNFNVDGLVATMKITP